MRLDAHLLNLIRTAARRRRPLPAASFLVAIVVVVATLAASLTLLLTSDTAHGANFTVTTGSDGVDFNPGDGICSAGLPACRPAGLHAARRDHGGQRPRRRRHHHSAPQ